MPAHRRDADFQPELRKNVVTREWVIIAKGRGKRPSDFLPPAEVTEEIPAWDKTCPFCPGNEAKTPPELYAIRNDEGENHTIEGENKAPWRIRVVPNKFAALRPDIPDRLRQVGLYATRDGYGAHEVIVESPEHNKDLWEMETSQVEAVIEAYRQRFLAYESAEGPHYVLVFRNHGARAGTSLIHPHSQLIVAPVTPHQVHLELQGAAEYWEYLGRCVFCAIVDQEMRGDERTVLQTPHFIAVTAFAGKYPFETWILPKRHGIRFAGISEAEKRDLALVLKEVLGRMAHCLGKPSYNFAIHTAPAAEHNIRAYHWHMEIFPRITTLGGFELGSDIYINPVAPEDAAQMLRETKVEALV